MGWSSSQTRSHRFLDESLDTKQYPGKAGPSGDSYISAACLGGEEITLAIDLLGSDNRVLSTRSSVKIFYQWSNEKKKILTVNFPFRKTRHSDICLIFLFTIWDWGCKWSSISTGRGGTASPWRWGALNSVTIKQRSKYVSRVFRKEGKLLAYKDDLRQTDSQHSDFAGLTEFW